MKNIIIIGMILLGTLAGCYRDNETTLYPATGDCDISSVTYVTTVVPILQNNSCTGCHSGAAPSGNISLSSYAGVKAVAQNGKLYGTITHAGGYSPMPQGGNKMSACEISKIKAWIDAGILNN